jgi:hypothetical protein
MAALMSRFEHMPILTLKLSPLELAQGGRTLAAIGRLCSQLFASMTLRAFENSLHLHGIPKSPVGIELNGTL